MTTRLLAVILLAAAVLPSCKKKSPMAPEVIPDYAGTWTGTYAVTSCTSTGFFVTAGFCAGVLNTTAQVTFTLSETDRTVSGSFQLGSLAFPNSTSTIAGDGSLALAATRDDPAFPITATWTLRQQTVGTLSGQTHQVWKANGQSGEGVIDGQLSSATR